MCVCVWALCVVYMCMCGQRKGTFKDAPLAPPGSYEELYAFSYNPQQNDQQREEGWQLIGLGAEFERMGVPCDQWQLTDVNRDYKVGGTVWRGIQ